MAEKDVIYSSNIKIDGLFSFKNLYKFCYSWLTEEWELDVTETKYKEKIKPDSKEVEIVWEGVKKATDYFKFHIKVEFETRNMKEVEVQKSGAKIKMNKGDMKIKCKGTLIRDYDGKFEKDAFRKFLRSIYEKWVIPGRIEQFEVKLFGDCDKFLEQTKAFLALEGRK